MFNWREFDRMMDEMFNTPMSNRGWDKKTYRSPDGSISYTYMTRGINNEPKNDELELLKHKLEVAIEKQEFEEAVELRDKIKSLEENKEKIDWKRLYESCENAEILDFCNTCNGICQSKFIFTDNRYWRFWD